MSPPSETPGPPSETPAGAARAVKEARSVVRSLRRVAASILDSPTAEADARDVFAGWRIGLWLGLLIATIAASAFSAAGFYFSGERPFPVLVAKHGIGAVLVAGLQLATIGFLSIAVPLRASGLIEGPRWRGYFDQLVASGIAPWRYFAGRVLVTQALIALVIAGTLPVLALFWLVDPAPVGRILAGYLLTVVYAELLLAVSLGLAVLFQEVGAILVTILLHSLLTFTAWMPVPSALVAISPVRWVIAPFAPSFSYTDTSMLEVFYGSPRPFGVEVPFVPYALGLSLVLGVLAALPCVFGPLYAFLPGFNNFGTVVLPGDRTRAAFRRIRPMLQRRTDIAFFFENRGPRLARLAPWVRLAQISTFLLVIGTVFIAALANVGFTSQFMGSMSEADLAGVVPLCLAAVLILGPVLFATARNEANVSLRLAGLELPVVLGDLAAYALVLLALGGLLALELARLLPAVTPRHVATTGQAYDVAIEWFAILAVVSWTALVITKSIGLRAHTRGGSAFLGLFAVSIVCMVLAARNPVDLRDRDDKFARTETENARILAAIHIAWPLRLALAVRVEALDGVRLPASGPWRWLAFNGFWVLYPAFDVAQLLVVLTLLRKRRAEAEAELAAIAAGAAAP